MGDERNTVVFLGENASLESQPIVGMNKIGMIRLEIAFDIIAVFFLDFADGNSRSFSEHGRDNLLGNEFGISAATETEQRVERCGVQNMHKIDGLVRSGVGDDEVDVDSLLGESFA